jgi:hypothetical protein
MDNEWDYQGTMVRIRKAILPEEVQEVYGEGAWYGDHL